MLETEGKQEETAEEGQVEVKHRAQRRKVKEVQKTKERKSTLFIKKKSVKKNYRGT